MFAPNPAPTSLPSPTTTTKFSTIPLSPIAAATSALPPAIDPTFRDRPPPYSAIVPTVAHGGPYFNPHRSAADRSKSIPLLAVPSSSGAGGILSSLFTTLTSLGTRSEEEALLSTSDLDSGVPAVQLVFRTLSSLYRSLSSALTPANISFVGLCSLWYLSSALQSNTAKVIVNGFNYPVTLTFAQFFFVAGYCLAICAIRNRFAGGARGVRSGGGGLLAQFGVRSPTRTALEGTFAMSIFQIAGHVFSSMAIARAPVSTVHTIKALSPLFTVLSYAVLFRVRYSSATYLSLLPLTLGVMLACSGELSASGTGFLFALGSTVVFVSQNIFSKKLLPKDDVPSSSHGGVHEAHHPSRGGAGKLDKLELLLFSSGMAFCVMIPIWAYSDGLQLASHWWHGTPVASKAPVPVGKTIWFFFLNGTVHWAQNYLAFATLARTSPVTYSIAGLVKRIVVICFAIVTFGQHVGGPQTVGIALTFTGLYMYNRAKGDVDRSETLREKRDALVLPTTQDDAQVMMSTTPPRSRSPGLVPVGQVNPLIELGRTRPRRLSISRDRGAQ